MVNSFYRSGNARPDPGFLEKGFKFAKESSFLLISPKLSNKIPMKIK